jgi:8-amino-7-oxononanoate synthase
MDIFEKANKWTAADDVRKTGLYPYFRAITSGQDTEVVVGGKKMIMVGSNNYLGLVNHPEVKEAMIKAIEKYGSSCTGSRFLNGTLDLHEELEGRLASFVGQEASLVYSTGFQANLGVLSTIATRGDYIVSDRENHASIVDGQKLSFAKTVKYEHSNMEDLERVLAHHKDDPKLIVTDGIFSMGGDICKLPRMIDLKKKYGARIMVDEAHSIGVLGKHGEGTGFHFGLQKEVDIVMATFSKSFAALGGFIASTDKVIDYLRHNSRPLIFSASMPPASVAGVLKALEIMQREPERIQKLWAVVRKMKRAYEEMGYQTGVTESPIIPLHIGEDRVTFQMAKELGEEGVFATPIVSPAVPPGMALIRTSYSATHTDAQLDFVLSKFRKIGQKLGVIPAGVHV